MLKIGLVDLDTSHPGRWVPILQGWDEVEVVACWDGGMVHPSGHAQRFAQEHKIATVVDTLEEMASLVDVAFVQSSDWDLHVARAKPFVEAGKGIYIDKPLAGNLSDLFQLQSWVAFGANIIGGSSLRCCDEVLQIRNEMEDGEPLSVFVTSPNDFFNYGIHAIEVAQGVVGAGAESVTHLGAHHAEHLQVTYRSGLQVFLELCSPVKGFTVSATATTGRWQKEIQSDYYRALLQAIVAHFQGEATFPASIQELCEAPQILLAGRESRRRRGEPVFLDELAVEKRGFDGHAFNAAYRIGRVA